jgi:carbon storage regulator
MLVLSRRSKESILVGNQITVTVVEIRGNQVRLAIEAPKEVRVLRTELIDAAAGKIVAA